MKAGSPESTTRYTMDDALHPWRRISWRPGDVKWAFEKYEHMVEDEDSDADPDSLAEREFYIGLASYMAGQHEEAEERFRKFQTNALATYGGVQNAQDFLMRRKREHDEAAQGLGTEEARVALSYHCMANLMQASLEETTNKKHCAVS